MTVSEGVTHEDQRCGQGPQAGPHRKNSSRQTRGGLFFQGKVCALGLLSEVIDHDGQGSHDYFGAKAGLTPKRVEAIIKMNDQQKMSFAEIADVVDCWFQEGKYEQKDNAA